MKKRVLLVLLLILALALCACDKRAQTPGDIIPMLREELQLEENDGTVISCIGVYTADPTTSAWVFENSLLWFSFDHDNYTYYRAVGCQQTSSGKFIVRKIYEPMTYTEDIVHVVWGGNDVYCVNDPNCRTIYSQFSSGNICMTEIPLGDHPCIYVYDGAYSLDFLDEHGKSVRDGRPILPSENDAIKPPVEDTELQVSSNPAIQNLLDTLNAVLAENGHPITLAMKDPTAATHQGELRITYNGDGANPYADLCVDFHQFSDTLGQTYEDSFDCSVKNDPLLKARDAARIIYQTAITLYDSVLNQHYARAFVSLADGMELDESRDSIYGISVRMMYDSINDVTDIRTRHEIRGLQLMH